MTWHASTGGRVGASPVVEYGQTLDDLGGKVDPEIAAYNVLADKVFAIADSIGIGKEVRTLYYALAAGQRTGALVSQVAAATPVISGSAVVSLAGTISSLASVVGIVLGVISLFGDDGESKAAARLVARVTKLLKWQSIDDLIAEQHDLATTATIDIDALVKEINSKQSVTIPQVVARIHAAQSAAKKLEALFIALKARLSPDELSLFVATSNLSRWEQYRVGWNAMSQAQRDVVRKYIDLGHLLDLRIAEATAQVKAVSATLAQKNVKLAKYSYQMTPAGSAGSLLVGAVVLGGVGLGALALVNPPLAAAVLAGAKLRALGAVGWVRRMVGL